MTRDQGLVILLGRMEQRPEYAERYLPRYFPPEMASQYKDDLAGMRKYYEENIEFVYVVKNRFCVDEDLKSLGMNSNRNVAAIKTLIELLDQGQKAKLARECRNRYTDQTFQSAQAWNKWYEENSQRLIFSDRGGYRFYKIPDLN